MKKIGSWIALLALLGTHCNNPDLEDLDFFEVELQPIAAESLNDLHLKGQVITPGTTATGSCGFIWSYDRKKVEAISADVQTIPLPFPSAGGNAVFETTLRDLEGGKTVWVRAFAETELPGVGHRKVYSANIELFSIGEIVALTGVAEVRNNVVLLFGQLSGLETLGQKVDKHGHVISPTLASPALGCSDCLSSDRGGSNDDAVFGSQIGELDFNTSYYARAYAIAGTDTFYSTRTDTFRVRDGWLRIGDFPATLTEGTAVADFATGRAYAGIGCQNENGVCLGPELNNQRQFWSFNPNSAGTLGKWTETQNVINSVFGRTNAVSFAIDGIIYVVSGGFYDNSEFFPVGDFCKYDPQADQWTKLSYPGGMTKRSGAVAFVANKKAYVGTGVDAADKEYNDFWEYDPLTNKWRPVASLPADAARYEAAAFTVGGYGYVATGQKGPQPLYDCWRFRPPVDDTDQGEWVAVAGLLPEDGRWQAVAFSIDGYGYVATGYHLDNGYLNDLWRYDPVKNEWEQKTPFQGVARTNALGFSLSGFGYLGTGNTKVQLNGGLALAERSLPDFWRYIPEKN